MKKYLPYTLYAALALIVAAPLYRAGYVLLLDMVFAPAVRLPAIVGGVIPSSYPIFALTAFVAGIIGSAATEKIILTLILFLPAVFMYRLARRFFGGVASGAASPGAGWATLAGVFYAFNPWTYERWLSGQWLVMLGYALFPLAVAWLWDLLVILGKYLEDGSGDRHISTNGVLRVLRFAILFAIYPIIDLHFAYLFAAFAILLVIVWKILLLLEWRRERLENRGVKFSARVWRDSLVALLVIVLVFFMVNNFWLYGVAQGGGTLAGISGQDFSAFVTQGDAHLGAYFNVAALYGFWSTDYVLPKDNFPLWWLIALAFFVLAAIGACKAFKRRPGDGFEPGRVLFIAAVIAFPVAWVLAVGYASGFSTHIVAWLAASIPGFKGLRETEKFGGLLAFSYALLIPLGGEWIAERVGARFDEQFPARGLLYSAVAICIALSVYDMPFAFFGQVAPVEYPASWYQANAIASSSSSSAGAAAAPPAVLVFPWEAYIDLSFDNFHQVADPASAFFDAPTITSGDTGNADISVPQGLLDKYVFNLVQGTATVDDTIAFLQEQNIGYILLLKESDWQRYGSFLDSSTKLQKALDSNELTLYRVE